jgi:hypothetical protein
LVNYTYKSWLALMKRLQSQLDSKTYWLEMLRSDAELVKICGASLDGIRTKATEILAQIAPVDIIDTQQPKTSKVKKSKKSALSQTDDVKHAPQTSDRHVFNTLFEIYRNCTLKAADGFEPSVEVLQTSALPLGYAATPTLYSLSSYRLIA